MKQKVVIIGHGFTSRLGVIRAVAEIGCDITVIVLVNKKRFGKGLDRKRPVDCFSKYVNRVLFCYKKDADALIRLILDECVDKGQKTILIPDSDFSASVIDENYNLLSKDFIFPNINKTEGLVTEWMDKSLQKTTASKLSLNVAPSFDVDIVDRKYQLPSHINYPCFPKPSKTIQGDKIMKVCSNEEELRRVINKLGEKGDNRVLVEDYMPIEDEYAVLGFSDGNTVIIPGIIHFLIPSKTHKGLAMQGEVLPVIGFEPLVDAFKNYVKEVGYVGVFDIDFYKSGGLFYFGEMNLRYGGSGYAITKTGVNLPAMMVESFLGKRIDGFNREVKDRAVFVNERMCLDDWYQGYLTTKQYQQIQKTSDISFIYDIDDFQPQIAFERLMKSMKIKRLFWLLKKRIYN